MVATVETVGTVETVEDGGDSLSNREDAREIGCFMGGTGAAIRLGIDSEGGISKLDED